MLGIYIFVDATVLAGIAIDIKVFREKPIEKSLSKGPSPPTFASVLYCLGRFLARATQGISTPVKKV
jgi:hypothetical protein